MKTSGKISTNSDMDSVLTRPVENVNDPFKVLPEILREMDNGYRYEAKEYAALHEVFLMERENARRNRKLKLFPPTFRKWLDSRGINVQLDDTAYDMKLYSFSKNGGRTHNYHRGDIITYSSKVCQQSRHGRIKSIFSHTFQDCPYIWFLISTYPLASEDPVTGLYFSANNSMHTQPVLVSNISKPLYAAEEGQTMWFLGSSN